MSIQATLGQPIAITIDGKPAKLHPLSLYELGQLEADYSACCRRMAIASTLGQPEHERYAALTAEAAHIAGLDSDISPIIDWVVGSSEGLCKALHHCVEMPGEPDGVSPRKIGRWYCESGKDSEGSPTYRWMIASRLRPDPTVAVDATAPANASEATGN